MCKLLSVHAVSWLVDKFDPSSGSVPHPGQLTNLVTLPGWFLSNLVTLPGQFHILVG